MATELVGILLDGVATYHAPAIYGTYDTLCGIDANDPTIGHGGKCEVPMHKFITCETCYLIWKKTLQLGLREKDFLPGIRKEV